MSEEVDSNSWEFRWSVVITALEFHDLDAR